MKFGENYVRCCLINLAKVNEVGEANNQWWYFFRECFERFDTIMVVFLVIFPYVFIIPLVRLTLNLSDNYFRFDHLPEKGKVKLLPQKKTEPIPDFKPLRREVRPPLSLESIEDHFMVNAYIVLFFVFFLSKPYGAAYDFLLLVPFLSVKQGYVSKTVMAVLLFFLIFYAFLSQIVSWNLWQKRQLANPNFYFAENIVSSVGISIYAYNLAQRLLQKNIRMIETLKLWDNKQKQE